MADPNESHRDDRSPRPEPTPNTPEVVDAELVDVQPGPRASPASPPADEEQFRQYQQFLEFQKFQEWQRGQGTAPGAAPPPPAGAAPPAEPPRPQRRPLWRKALGVIWSVVRPLARRLLFLAVALVLLLLLLGWAVQHYFGAGGGGGGGGGTGGVPQEAAPVTPESPQRVIRAFYGYIAHQPEQACALFTETGKSAFAYHFQSGDCATAASRARAQVTEPNAFGSPGFTNDVIQLTGTQALVDSCSLRVSGGPPLGKFSMSKQPDGGWQIDNYEPVSCS
ncbi:hypothetical protein ACL03H_19155 [Saccharopolyspora sp. MS10]|uniref:hypothetical protein n=1 Tax=Saccharopolyspora sp. MS10 TaxID=3385973 RepID=UPI0039A0C73B